MVKLSELLRDAVAQTDIEHQFVEDTDVIRHVAVRRYVLTGGTYCGPIEVDVEASVHVFAAHFSNSEDERQRG